MAAVILQLIPRLYTIYLKSSLFNSARTYEKYILRKNTLLHATMTRFASYVIVDITLYYLETLKGCYKKLNAFCFNYQHLPVWMSVYTFRVQIRWQNCCQEWTIFWKCAWGSSFRPPSRRIDRLPSIGKKIPPRRKYEKHLLSSFQKTKSMRTNEPVFADRNEQVRTTEFELALIKVVDCFPDGLDIYTSDSISFKTK